MIYPFHLIHSFYWENVCENRINSETNLEECIISAIPFILDLKKKYEDLVRKEYEYEYNADEEQILSVHELIV